MPDNHALQTEPDRIRAMPILATVIGFVIFAGICIWLLLAYYHLIVGPGLYVPPRSFPAPQLQTTPLSDLEKLQAAQLARIERYGWIDQSKGILRVPIQRAMEIVVSKGEQALAPLAPPQSPPTPAGAAEAVEKVFGQTFQGGKP